MNEKMKPLGFGEILDQTFRIIKSNFKPLFAITFFIMIPIFALQALILSLTGRNLVIGGEERNDFFEQILSNTESITATTTFQDMTDLLLNMLVWIVIPVLAGAITWAVKYAREDKKIEATDMIKKTFKRFWPLLGSSILIGIITFFLFIPIFIVLFIAFIVIFGMDINPVIGFFLGMFSIVAIFICIGLLVTRWSLYLPAVLFEKVAPGLGKSWHLTKKQTWKFFGLIIVLSIISGIISTILEIPLVFLGNSVLYQLLSNIITLISSIVFTVGYAVMYFDATVRQEGSDLKEMIKDYDTQGS
ncbi:hypothetical protein SH601_10365 [Gracilibacillus sp. S3-1-1]|uniref:Uncharacterized protein n=1 Tax=Gracilibacillus pellucidus TaxID=3095368 RepID=A0ACC6M604_9BACI|nr:hypothetical protein [Gracilibacillus sp. S3-1-1]MDX8046384.1 hypothetical protein [Gracilibacillus sp. S3-1-1]